MKYKYYEDYGNLTRFISYYYQIAIIKKLKPNKVLEIGIGDRTVSDYLKRGGLKVTTCDIDKLLCPDYVADIRKLPIKNNEFELISACEILEHIPYTTFEVALRELQRVTKKYVVISIPYSQIYFGCFIIFPFIQQIFNRRFLNFFIGVPSFTKIRFNGEHYWELGRRGYSISRIRKDIRKYFKIIEEKRALPHPTHYFFVLEKKV